MKIERAGKIAGGRVTFHMKLLNLISFPPLFCRSALLPIPATIELLLAK
jgi:hypothetical protein